MTINEKINNLIEYRKHEDYYYKKIEKILSKLEKDFQKISAKEYYTIYAKMKELKKYFRITFHYYSENGKLHQEIGFVNKVDLGDEDTHVYVITFVVNEPLILKTKKERLKVLNKLENLVDNEQKIVLNDKDFQYSFKDDEEIIVFSKKFKTKSTYNIYNVTKTLDTKDDPKYYHLKPLLLYLLNNDEENIINI